MAAPIASVSAAAPITSATAAPAEASAAPAEPLPAGEPELARFQAALRELGRGARKAHVRILWLGDSHGQADFWTGALRDVGEAEPPAGVPGMLVVGEVVTVRAALERAGVTGIDESTGFRIGDAGDPRGMSRSHSHG